MSNRISVLCASRPNSSYLANFIMGYFNTMKDTGNIELLVMLNKHDKWNKHVVKYFDGRVKFFYEDSPHGRFDLHTYYTELLKHANGDWIMLACEDWDFLMDGWDNYIREVASSKGADSSKVWGMVPRFSNVGSVCQIMSRGYVNAVGGVLGHHYAIDSWINTVFGTMEERMVHFEKDMFIDYTHGGSTLNAAVSTNRGGGTYVGFSTDLVKGHIDTVRGAINAGK